MLVVAGIVALLIAIVGAAVGSARTAAKSFMCKNKLRNVGFEFSLFADDQAHTDRGDDERYGGRFAIETFQEKLYRIDEFWDLNEPGEAEYTPAGEPLICPAGPQQLKRRPSLPCSRYAVVPVPNVSVGFNMRLHRRSQRIGNRWVLRPILLSQRILENPLVPLAVDLDGAEADRRGRLPYYLAPAAQDGGQYGGGQFWFPAFRHGGMVNVCFVGGHVLSSADPESEPGWDWAHQPDPN